MRTGSVIAVVAVATAPVALLVYGVASQGTDTSIEPRGATVVGVNYQDLAEDEGTGSTVVRSLVG